MFAEPKLPSQAYRIDRTKKVIDKDCCLIVVVLALKNFTVFLVSLSLSPTFTLCGIVEAARCAAAAYRASFDYIKRKLALLPPRVENPLLSYVEHWDIYVLLLILPVLVGHDERSVSRTSGGRLPLTALGTVISRISAQRPHFGCALPFTMSLRYMVYHWL